MLKNKKLTNFFIYYNYWKDISKIIYKIPELIFSLAGERGFEPGLIYKVITIKIIRKVVNLVSLNVEISNCILKELTEFKSFINQSIEK